MNYDNRFHALIERPLEDVVGKVMHHASYWILDFDTPTFSLEEPNESGVYAVSLVLGDQTLEVFPSWEKEFRDESAHYHIEARVNTPTADGSDLVNAEHLVKIAATNSRIWQDVLFQTVTSVEVYGIHQTPQVIRLCFQPVAILIATGYSGKPPIPGDGDEILISSNIREGNVPRIDLSHFEQIWKC